MGEPNIVPVAVRAERVANRVLEAVRDRPALEGIGGIVLALSHILNDPTAPPRPPIMDDMAVLCGKFVREFTAFAEEDRRFFARQFTELGTGRVKRRW
jgi:hypothetical protein